MIIHLTAADPVAARSQMGFSLAWHIILACFGVGLPGLVPFTECRGMRHRRPAPAPARPPLGPGPGSAVLLATLISLAVGAFLLIPSLAWLYLTFQRGSSAR
jgi:hypothetical protein